MVFSSCGLEMYPCGLETAPSRCRSWPRCYSSLLSSEPGRGTCTYPHLGTGTCTRLLRRAKCWKKTEEHYFRLHRPSGGISKFCVRTIQTHLFIKLTMYTMRGVQIMGWSVRMALMDCFTQNSGLNGGRNGSISFLTRPGRERRRKHDD